MTPDLLIVYAANKFKVLQQTRQWLVPDKIERKVLAMKTVVDKLEQKQSHILQGYNARGYENCTKCYSNYSLYCNALQNKYKTPFKSYWLFHQVKLLNLKETCTFEGKMYYFCCKENGSHCNNK